MKKDVDHISQWVHRVSLPSSILLKPELSNQRNEANISNGAGANPFLLPLDQGQRLRLTIAQWNDHAATHRKLLDQGRRYFRRGRGYQNRVVGSERAPSQGTVAHQDGHVAYPRGSQCSLCALGQGRHPFDAEDHAGKQRQERGLVPGSSADLQHLLLPRETDELQVACLDVWLRDGLAAADGKSRVIVRVVPDAFGDEQVPWYRSDRPQHRKVADPFALEHLD